MPNQYVDYSTIYSPSAQRYMDERMRWVREENRRAMANRPTASELAEQFRRERIDKKQQEYERIIARQRALHRQNMDLAQQPHAGSNGGYTDAEYAAIYGAGIGGGALLGGLVPYLFKKKIDKKHFAKWLAAGIIAGAGIGGLGAWGVAKWDDI